MKRKNFSDICFDAIVMAIMLFVFIVTVYPFYYILIMSFNDGIDGSRGGIYFFPRMFSLDNYIKIFSDDKWVNAIIISVSRTVSGTFLGMLFSGIMAYALSYPKLLFRKVYFFLVIFSMYFSGGLIPYYVVLKQLRLTNNFLVYIIPGCVNVFFVLILIAFFREIPEAIKESAKIDGANDLVTYFRIIVPLSLPVFATIALFFGVGQWNAWWDSAFFVQKAHLRPLAYVMMDIINKSAITSMMSNTSSDPTRGTLALRVTTVSLQMACMVVAVVPILCVYPFLQKYFVKGMMVGSVKG